MIIVRSAHRSGLTLIEIAMVLSIAATIGGLVLYGLLSARQRTPLNSTEHLLRSTIRQARQTAQSEGLPVEIKISQADRTLRGITNTVIIAENFEAMPGQGQNIQELPTPRQPVGENPITPGYAGYGWSLGIRDTSGSGLRSDKPSPLPLASPRGRRLLAQKGDGFTFSVMFKPAYLDDDRNATLPPVEIASWVDSENLRTKISLELGIYREFDVNGWYYPRCSVATPTGKGVIQDQTIRINGDNWITMTVSYDGNQMRLFVGDQVLDEAITVPPFRLEGPAGVVVGSGRRVSRPIGIVDNVRLVASGTGKPIQLPGGVEPDQDYRVVIDATNVRVNGQSSGTLRFTNGPGPVLNTAITASGLVRPTYSEENE